MCGIAGIFEIDRKANYDRTGLARQLLLAIEARGKHATGCAYVQGHATIIEKADVPARDFVAGADYFTATPPYVPRALLLHARYATQGSPTNNQNNHPIYSKRTGLTLIHNGWLTNEPELLRRFHLKKDADVDSETVLRLIEHFVLNKNKRILTAIKLAMHELKGVFACALISERYPDTLWLWRSGYPLAYCHLPESDTLVFASTQPLLQAALKASGLDADEVVEFPADHAGVVTVTKGKFNIESTRLRHHKPAQKRKKKQKPIVNKHPLIGMPVHRVVHNDQLCYDKCTAPIDCFCRCHDQAPSPQSLLKYADNVLRRTH